MIGCLNNFIQRKSFMSLSDLFGLNFGTLLLNMIDLIFVKLEGEDHSCL